MDIDDFALRAEHVDAGYPGATILNDVSFSVKHGEIFALLGPSGCGKSTMMRHMIGLSPVLAGRIEVAGMEWSWKNRTAIRRRIGVMFQSGALFGSMSVLENVMLPLEEFTRMKSRERRDKAMHLLSLVGMADAAGMMPSDISGGMKKRTAIARAMALEPEILFLDEPSAGLDPATSFALDELILSLRGQSRMTFVIVTHELASIFKIADRCAIFDRSRRCMVAEGSPHDLRTNCKDPFVTGFFNRGELAP